MIHDKLVNFETNSSSTAHDFVVVIARRMGDTLLVFNRARQRWELPGGRMDREEGAIACAKRELFEESGYRARTASVAGFVEVESGGEPQRGIVIMCELRGPDAFKPNGEVARIGFLGELLPAERMLVDRAALDILRCSSTGLPASSEISTDPRRRGTPTPELVNQP